MPSTHPLVRTCGFTLVELMISVSLGLVLLLTCFAGLRLTAQTVVASKRLSEENSLLRLGVERALDETDFWTLSDDPTNPGQQTLRGTEVSPPNFIGTAYLPFTPFTQTPDYVQDPLNGTTGFQDNAVGYDESLTAVHAGWNPHPLAWAAWNPRTWTRGCVAETDQTAEYFGTYEIYDNLDKTQSWHYWYDDQVRGMIDALGFFGIYEYLPSNAYIIYHGTTPPLGSPPAGYPANLPPLNLAGIPSQPSYASAPMTWGSCPYALMHLGAWQCPFDGGDNIMKGRIRDTNGSRYFFPGPQAVGATNPGITRTFSAVGYNGRLQGGGLAANDPGNVNSGNVALFLSNSMSSAELMPMHPVTWNDVTYEVHRCIERGHPLALNVVSCRSPLSAAGFVVSFTCMGTTLRGARQQRTPTPSGGWVVNPYTDATLDYAVPP